MRSKAEFDRLIATLPTVHERFATIGALLAKETGLGQDPVVVGGCEISIYTSGHYISGDLDLVGGRGRILPVLRRWGFVKIEADGQVYWGRPGLGLFLDVLRPRYPGNREALHTFQTANGPVQLAAIEDLIVRRLMLWSKSGRPELMDQAVLLMVEHRSELDFAYLQTQVKYEHPHDALRELNRLLTLQSGLPGERIPRKPRSAGQRKPRKTARDRGQSRE